MNIARTLACLCLLSLLAGCLEFDAQDVYLRYDADKNRIDALIVYRGMFAEGSNNTPQETLDKAIADLDEAKSTGEFCFWNNWPLSCNPSRDYDAVRDALVRHLEVENGGLFTDPKDLLCGYQFVRINDAKGFVAKVNTVLEVAVQAMLADSKRLAHEFDEETEDGIRDFLRRGDKMLTLESGRIELRLPVSAGDHAWLKQQLETRMLQTAQHDVLRQLNAAAEDDEASAESRNLTVAQLEAELRRAPALRFFFDNEFSFVRTEERTTIGLGVAGAPQLHVHKAPFGIYDDALLKALRERKEPIEAGLPDAEVMRRFNEFRTRDARLPEHLAARRG